jgi:hypothetical protein
MKSPAVDPLSSRAKQADNMRMPRWLIIAALGATLLANPVWAQRGGGGGHGGMGGGGHAASSGGYAARSAGGYAYRGGSGYSRAPSYSSSPRAGAYWSGSYRGWNGSGWNGGRGPYRPWGWGGRGYPWWGYGYLGWGGYPWWGWYGGLGWYDSSYYADNSYPYYSYDAQTSPSYVYVTPNGSSDDDSQAYQVQQDEINRLNNEVERLQAQGQSQNPASRPQGKTAEIHAETVLIYRDGRSEEVQNYAIVGKTIWVFNEARAKKIPLSDLDLAATRRSNEDRGIDFVLPNPSH